MPLTPYTQCRFAGDLADDWTYDGALTDSEVEDALSAPRTEYEG